MMIKLIGLSLYVAVIAVCVFLGAGVVPSLALANIMALMIVAAHYCGDMASQRNKRRRR